MTESTETVRVFIVEDDKDFIFLIEKMLERQPEITVIGSCSKKEDAVKMVCGAAAADRHHGFKLRHFRSGTVSVSQEKSACSPTPKFSS